MIPGHQDSINGIWKWTNPVLPAVPHPTRVGPIPCHQQCLSGDDWEHMASQPNFVSRHLFEKSRAHPMLPVESLLRQAGLKIKAAVARPCRILRWHRQRLALGQPDSTGGTILRGAGSIPCHQPISITSCLKTGLANSKLLLAWLRSDPMPSGSPWQYLAVGQPNAIFGADFGAI